jgi:hypothetical protein
MALLRSFTWALLLIAASFAGPNVPVQFMAAVREAVATLGRRLLAFRS